MLCLTSQSTTLVNLNVLKSLRQIKAIAKTIKQRPSGWRDMQLNASFPVQSTHLGYRCTTCAISPVISYAGRLT
jgi:hypothetical protein